MEFCTSKFNDRFLVIKIVSNITALCEIMRNYAKLTAQDRLVVKVVFNLVLHQAGIGWAIFL